MRLFIVLLIGCFLGGCTQQIYLKKSPSELVLTSIKSENQKEFSYTFKSRIPDTLIIGNFAFDVNATYMSNLKIYMNTKYSVVDEDTIFTTDEYNGNNNSISSLQNSFDQAIGKSIIMIDKFLSTIE